MEKRIQDVCPTPVAHRAGENQAPILDVVERLRRGGRRECLVSSNMDGGLNADNVVADGRQLRKSAPNLLSDSCWFVMKKPGEDVHPVHQLFGEQGFVGLRAINKFEGNLSTLTQPPDPELFHEWPKLRDRLAQGLVEFSAKESRMPLAILEQDFVRMSELAPQVQDGRRLLQTLQVRWGQLLIFMGRSHAGQADVIDRAVWTCQWLGLLEVFAKDGVQNPGQARMA